MIEDVLRYLPDVVLVVTVLPVVVLSVVPDVVVVVGPVVVLAVVPVVVEKDVVLAGVVLEVVGPVQHASNKNDYVFLLLPNTRHLTSHHLTQRHLTSFKTTTSHTHLHLHQLLFISK